MGTIGVGKAFRDQERAAARQRSRREQSVDRIDARRAQADKVGAAPDEEASCAVCDAELPDVGFVSDAGRVCETCSLVVESEEAVLKQVRGAFGPLWTALLLFAIAVAVGITTDWTGASLAGKGLYFTWFTIWVVGAGFSLYGAAGSVGMARAASNLGQLEQVTAPSTLRVRLLVGAALAASSGLVSAALWTWFFLNGP